MLSPRMETILKSIVAQYIVKATPVPSHSITRDAALKVSSATIRNEMAQLEQEGYITRPHTSAGSVPLDKGYRIYVASLGEVKFPAEEQRMINHLFHQVEQELNVWLNLAATLVAQRVQNISLITMPRTDASQFQHLELVSLQDFLALVVLVLRGARVRQKLINFDHPVSQEELTAMAHKLSALYSGLTARKIINRKKELNPAEQRVTEYLVDLMDTEDRQGNEELYLDGLHFTLNQPEFTRDLSLAQELTGLIEQRSLFRSILPAISRGEGVRVIIGKENDVEAVREYSVVISRYGLPDEAEGYVCVIGPTRMPYGRTIATVNYLSLVLSGLIARLWGREIPENLDTENAEDKGNNR
jgi:heat-inducible transcriptional repressor